MIQDKDTYEEKRKEFESSKAAAQAKALFAIKPYVEKYKNRNRAAKVLSYLFNALSVSSASTLVFFFILGLSYSSLGEYANYFALFLTFGFLALLEFFKRDTATEFFKDKKQFRKTNYKLLSVILFLFLVSVGMSYQGGKDLVNITDAGTQYVDTDTLKDVVALKERILVLRDEKNALEGQKNRQGETLYKVLPAINDKDKLITLLEGDISEIEKDYRETNKTATLKHDVVLMMKAEYFGVVTIVCEILYLFCIWFNVTYLYNSTIEFQKKDDELDEESVLTNEEKKSLANLDSQATNDTKGEAKTLSLRQHKDNFSQSQLSKSKDIVSYSDLVKSLIHTSGLDESKIQEFAVKISNYDLGELKKSSRNYHQSSTLEGKVKYNLAKFKLKEVGGLKVNVISKSSITFIKENIA